MSRDHSLKSTCATPTNNWNDEDNQQSEDVVVKAKDEA